MPPTLRSARPRARYQPDTRPSPEVADARLGLGTIGLVLASYLAALAAATWPVALTFGSRIAGEKTDPLMHLWLVRWAKTCLHEGRSPFFNPGVHYPVGVPLGFYPTMHLQSLQYLILSGLGGSDTVCLNLMWLGGIVGTGLAAFGLGWWVTRDRASAWLAGLSAMLAGPMMMHAHGHTELLQVWSFPLFLVAWIRFVDRPGVGRMVVAAMGYVLLAICAPYFPILATFPALLYLGWSWKGEGWDRRWLVGRVGWSIGFAVIVVPALAALFAGHIWAAWHGYHVTRPKVQFYSFRVPIWGYLVPSPDHALGKLLAPTGYGAEAFAGKMVETSSYLGVVALGVLAYAAIRRVRFPRAGFWWSSLALMAVLSLGGKTTVFGHEVTLPAGWIWSIFPPFGLIRVPSRFNLFALAVAAVPVAAGLKGLLGRIASPGWRAAAVSALGLVIVADLANVPFPTDLIPPPPDYYRDLAAKKPQPAILDAPSFIGYEIPPSTSTWGYWQSIHGGSTTAAYSSHPNDAFDAMMVIPSPWGGRRLQDPDYLRDEGSESFGAARGVGGLDYCWLFLTAHRLDFVAIHQGPTYEHRFGPGEARLKAMLSAMRSFEDEDVAIYDRDTFPEPKRLTWLCAEGYRPCRVKTEPWAFGVLREARVVVFNPEAGRPMTFILDDSAAFVRPREVRLIGDGRELARWRVELGSVRTLESPPFRLPRGLNDLKVVGDGDDRPGRYVETLDAAHTPYCFRINAVRLRPAD